MTLGLLLMITSSSVRVATVPRTQISLKDLHEMVSLCHLHKIPDEAEVAFEVFSTNYVSLVVTKPLTEGETAV